MKRMLLMAGLVAAALVIPAQASRASWVSVNCYINNVDDSHVRRLDAKAYAEVAIGEGYEWGGGCWNDNNRDDTPGQPDSSGEGPDCSGFVFKSWELRSTYGTSGFRWWNKFQNIHGPYSSSSYHSPVPSEPFYKLPNKLATTTIYMDAFAKDGHVAMLYSESGSSLGLDYMIEARGDAYGTNVWAEDYRSDSDYIALRREGWTPDCWPHCQAQPSRVISLP